MGQAVVLYMIKRSRYLPDKLSCVIGSASGSVMTDLLGFSLALGANRWSSHEMIGSCNETPPSWEICYSMEPLSSKLSASACVIFPDETCCSKYSCTAFVAASAVSKWPKSTVEPSGKVMIVDPWADAGAAFHVSGSNAPEMILQIYLFYYKDTSASSIWAIEARLGKLSLLFRLWYP